MTLEIKTSMSNPFARTMPISNADLVVSQQHDIKKSV
jgi:hypothetical protein